ncbi:MAG: transposase family protein [Chloroflexaceae bacterium]|nr:transposase family protein [Chloroflexaceae bacterium]
MLTEQMLRDYPNLVKALTGIPAEDFWAMMETLEQQYPDYTAHRQTRDQRQRAVGGGRPCDLPLVIRVTMLLVYLRTHIPQTLVALLFDGTQSDVSRDLRRLLPLLREVLPTPERWELDAPSLPDDPVPTDSATTDPTATPSTPLPATHVLVDATEQEVARPHDPDTRKQYYSGKQKEFTIKTQIVTDADHHIVAISVAVPGTMHDKKRCDALDTLDHLADGTTVELDKGYQGVANQVESRPSNVGLPDPESESPQPRLTVRTPHKKPRGGELTEAQKAENHAINASRVRVEHCIGWIKNWTILATQFRCDHAIYSLVMQVVCGLVNQQTKRWQEAKQAEAAYCA